MARTYVETTWAGADKFGYSGVQQHFTKNGGANTKAYEEKSVEKKANKVKAPDFRLTSEKTIDRLEKHRADLEEAFESGELSFDRYELLLSEWETKMERAWKRHEKASGIVQESTTVVEPSAIPKSSRPSIMPAIERAAVSFSSRNPFCFTVASVLFGCGVLNILGIAG